CDRTVAIARRLAFADGGDVVTEAGTLEVAGVGVDDRVRPEITTGGVDAVLAFAHAHVHVGVDRRLAALPYARHRPWDVRRRQVVQQHAVGHLASHAQHRRVEGADDDLRASFAQSHAEAEAAAFV